MIAPSVSLRIKIDGCSRGAPELYTNAFIHSRSSLQMNKVRPTHDHNTMTAWIAFLRGINMGGHNKIKMDDLTRLFESLALKNVTTFIQSGNVTFETAGKNADALARRIGDALQESLGNEVPVFLRTLSEIQDLVKLDPFKAITADAGDKKYVVFLYAEPGREPVLPLRSAREGLEAFHIRKREVFVLSRNVNGRFGFPNNFIEKELGVPATTRNWTTVSKLIA